MLDLQPLQVDADAFALQTALTHLLQEALKKPEWDGEDESSSSSTASAAVDAATRRTVAGLMAQSVSGFGL